MARTLCLLAFATSLFAQEFIFWAEFSNKDFVLTHQSDYISPAMTSSEAVLEEYLCDLPYTSEDLQTLDKTALGGIDDEMPRSKKLSFLNSHKNELAQCFTKAVIKVQDFVKIQKLQAQSQTFIKMLPTRFRVSFARDKAIIFRLVKRWE